jgi:hypothetical protein
MGLVLSFFVVPWQTRQAGACPAWARKGDRVADSWWTVIDDMVGEAACTSVTIATPILARHNAVGVVALLRYLVLSRRIVYLDCASDRR